MRRILLPLIILLSFYYLSCASMESNLKPEPEYEGVDPILQPYLDEYISLSMQNHIDFSESVTMGFKNIPEVNVIGLTTYRGWFREIDFDVDFWKRSSDLSHKMLVFHELTHAYCEREHDYDNGTKYEKLSFADMFRKLLWILPRKDEPGFFVDGCPKSIMVPYIQPDECSTKYFDWYVKEMFNRCIPY